MSLVGPFFSNMFQPKVEGAIYFGLFALHASKQKSNEDNWHLGQGTKVPRLLAAIFDLPCQAWSPPFQQLSLAVHPGRSPCPILLRPGHRPHPSRTSAGGRSGHRDQTPPKTCTEGTCCSSSLPPPPSFLLSSRSTSNSNINFETEVCPLYCFSPLRRLNLQ